MSEIFVGRHYDGSISILGPNGQVIDTFESLTFLPVDSLGNYIANIIPRTGTLAALSALTSGGGELASATDFTAIVQLNGPAGLGTSAAYSPMAPGTWNDATKTLTAAFLAGVAGSGLSFKTPDNNVANTIVVNTGSNNVNNSPLIRFSTGNMVGSVPFNSGDVIFTTGANQAAGNTGSTGTISFTTGNNSGTAGAGTVAGNITFLAGNTLSAAGLGGGVSFTGGTSPTFANDGGVMLNSGGAATPATIYVARSGAAAPGLAFFAAAASFSPVGIQTVTGLKGGNAALGSLLTALANYGLIINSSGL